MLEDFSPIRSDEPAIPAKFGSCAVPEPLQFVLSNRGIRQLYLHQCEGLQKIAEGKNIVIAAPTASGKSEIYLIPAVGAALRGKRTLAIYPTKALARDQLARWREFALLGVRAAVYDGDTSQHERTKARSQKPQIVVTNIDMLHFMLQNSRLFSWLWESLHFVVIDELHTYSGALGSHSANIISRLKRIARIHKRSDSHGFQFIVTSATIGNPREFAAMLCGEEFALQSAEGAPKPQIHHYIISPQGESYTTTSIKVAKEIGKRSLIFANSHAVVERLGMIAKDSGLGLRVYRSGLPQEERRRLESSFKLGAMQALASTSALELGMDIGGVDAIILCGFPGTITRVRQRIGRAGRRGEDAYAIFIARENPLDQYYVDNLSQYLHGEPENCYLNAQNPYVQKMHVLSMARDFPLGANEISGSLKDAAANLLEEGMLRKWGENLIPEKRALALIRNFKIRSLSGPVKIFDTAQQKFVGERDSHMAMRELFEGAIYLHGGSRYRCERLDLEKKVAYANPIGFGDSEYTTPLSAREAEVIGETSAREAFDSIPLSFGTLKIRDSVYGYTIKNYFSERTVGKRMLDEPLEHEFETMGIWADFSGMAGLGSFADGLHGFEHTFIAMMPALTGADYSEIGGISYPNGTMFIYDGVPFGSGVTQIAFRKFESIAKMALDRLSRCECKEGCPKCILSYQCGNNNSYLNKSAAGEIAKMAVG